MLKLVFAILIAGGVSAMEGLFGTDQIEICNGCYDEFKKSNANKKMIAVVHEQPDMDCTHYVYCVDCYNDMKKAIDRTLGKHLNNNHVENCPKDRQAGVLCMPPALDEENGEYGMDQNLLNHQRDNKDVLTQHLILNSLILVSTMTMWIALEEHGQLTQTWAKLGYVLQQLVRSYFGYVSFAGLVYSCYDRPSFQWTNAAYPWRLKPSYIALYLFTMTTSALMLCSHMLYGGLSRGESGEIVSNIRFWANITSWFSMIGGLLIGIYSQIFQKKTKFQDKRFANFQLSQPHDKIFGYVAAQTFQGYLAGVLFTIIPFFGLFQGLTITYRQQKYPEMYGSPTSFWHTKFIGGAEIATWCGVVGILLGAFLVPIAQYHRHENRIGTFTLDNMLLTGISFFLSFHSDPTAGIVLLFIELLLLCAAMRGGAG